MDYVTIDFEASCLPRHGRSFPIEVGIAGSDGTRSWLIRPVAGWRTWDWTEEALKLHGIHRERLIEEGLPAHQVYAELSRAIAGRRIIADSPVDGYWWRTLAGAAGEEGVDAIAHVSTVFDELGVGTDDIMAAQRHADSLCPSRHRAADDALWLWTLLSRLDPRVDAMIPAQFAGPTALQSIWSADLAA